MNTIANTHPGITAIRLTRNRRVVGGQEHAVLGWRVEGEAVRPIFLDALIGLSEVGLIFRLPDGTFYSQLDGPSSTLDAALWEALEISVEPEEDSLLLGRLETRDPVEAEAALRKLPRHALTERLAKALGK